MSLLYAIFVLKALGVSSWSGVWNALSVPIVIHILWAAISIGAKAGAK